MKEPVIPDPPLMERPARADVRRRWIGRYVRFSKVVICDPPPHEYDPDPETAARSLHERRAAGIGEVLDVGKAGWFLIRWEDGTVNRQWKRTLDFYKDEVTAAAFGPRLLPLEYGGGDLR